MGKDKRKSSLRALQIVLSKLKGSKIHLLEEEDDETAAAVAARRGRGKASGSNAWSFSCGQPKTHSFRVTTASSRDGGGNVYKSFNSLYIVSDPNSSASQSLFPLPEEEEREEEELSGVSKSAVIICDEKGRICDAFPNAGCSQRTNWDDQNWFFDEEESLELEFTSKSSSYSSDFSSESGRSTDLLAGLIRGLSSERFFFTPGRSNSILEEAKNLRTEPELVQTDDLSGRPKIDMPLSGESRSASSSEADLDVCWNEDHNGSEESSVDLNLSQRESIAEVGKDEYDMTMCDAFRRESVALMMHSQNPYIDFRISMQEMVDAHNLTDWSGLQELLCCYLNLNNKKTHKFIVGAFADLLMNLLAAQTTATPLLEYHEPCTD